MEKLIRLFNNKDTHIEVDNENQFENGTTEDKNKYSYTIYLIDNYMKEEIESVSVDMFSDSEVEFVIEKFSLAMERYYDG